MGEIILIIFGVYLLFQIVVGYRRGFLKALLMLVAWILTFAIAFYGADEVKPFVIKYFPEIQGNILSDHITYIIAFIITTIIVRLIFSVILHFLNKVNDLPGIGFVNKAAGGLLGFTKGVLVIAFLLFFVSMMPLVGMTDTYNQIMSSDEKVAYMIQNNPFEEILNYSKLNNI